MKSFQQEYSKLLQEYLLIVKSSYTNLLIKYNLQENNHLKQYKNFFDKYDDYCKKEIGSPLKYIDLPSIFRIKRSDENICSNIIAWFLDCHSTHNKGNIFYKSFIDKFKFGENFVSNNYSVYREYSRENSIVDIAIISSNFICFIENKVNSPEGVNQTDREYKDAVELANLLKITEKNVLLIFMSPDGKRAKNNKFINLSHYRFFSIIRDVVNTTNDELLKLIVNSLLKLYK
ncbi:MAG: PD-(D/E)XK nuclease family protein [Ignavibacteriaceae bacterium]|nr:PD-(D/E)XK nuclease family protein [Ignavibacteriaceae bacterium]